MTAPHNAGLFFCAERSQKRLYSRSPDTQPCPPLEGGRKGDIVPLWCRFRSGHPVLILC